MEEKKRGPGRPKRDDGRNAATISKNKYKKDNYVQISLLASPEGRQQIKDTASAKGMSISGYINALISNAIPDYKAPGKD